MKHLAVVIDWYGPYTRDEALDASKNDGYADGLYVGIGKQHRERGPSKPQYIGLSKNLATRIQNNHKLPKITHDARLWLGEIASFEPPGQKRKSTKASLDYAEWLHAFFLQLPLNEKRKLIHLTAPSLFLTDGGAKTIQRLGCEGHIRYGQI